MLHVLDKSEAESRGYRPVAGPYDLTHPNPIHRNREKRWWKRACQDLCTVDSVAVEVIVPRIGAAECEEQIALAMEIWRHHSELKRVTEENE